MQYVACKFRPEDSRSYTYEYDGAEPLNPGDWVKVPDAKSDGWKRVQVVSVGDEAPHFPCKPILGLVTHEDDFSADDTVETHTAERTSDLEAPIDF